MKAVANIVLIVAVVSLVLGIYSRLTLNPLPFAPGKGIEAQAFLQFTNTCLLIAIALMVKGKKQG
ncbi:hypothetical protein ACFL1D_05305 [Candidatus Omnitrophota bacterium]